MGSEEREEILVEGSSHAPQVSQAPQEQDIVPAPPPPPTPEESLEEKASAEEKQASSASSSSIPSSAPAAERKVPTEDSTAIIESLRARLLAERNSSKAAKQHVQQLTKKVKDLENRLEAEIQHRKRCEDAVQELLLKLDDAGVKLSPENSNTTSEDHEQEQEEEDEDNDQAISSSSSRKSKPSWISGSKRHHSDGSIEGDTVEQQSPSGSPRSDSSLAPKRVARSCRTLRRKETCELGVDEQVKSHWDKVGADAVELSKLREMTGSESGWLGRVIDMFESRNEGSSSGEQPDMERSDQQAEASSNASADVQERSSPSSSPSSTSSTENSAANSKSSEFPVMNIAHQDGNKTTEVGTETAAISSEEAQVSSDKMVEVSNRARSEAVPEENWMEEAIRIHQVEQLSSAAANKEDVMVRRRDTEVEDVLRALRMAKQQVLAGAGGGAERRQAPGINHGIVVTRPLAQFVHAAAPQF